MRVRLKVAVEVFFDVIGKFHVDNTMHDVQGEGLRFSENS